MAAIPFSDPPFADEVGAARGGDTGGGLGEFDVVDLRAEFFAVTVFVDDGGGGFKIDTRYFACGEGLTMAVFVNDDDRVVFGNRRSFSFRNCAKGEQNCGHGNQSNETAHGVLPTEVAQKPLPPMVRRSGETGSIAEKFRSAEYRNNSASQNPHRVAKWA